MTRRGLVGLFLLPLAFAALPLAAMAVSAANGPGAEPALIELPAPVQSTPLEAENLGFAVDDHSGLECSFGALGIASFNDS